MKQAICQILDSLGFDRTFLRMFREAYLPWGARAEDIAGGSAGKTPAPYTSAQAANFTGLAPGEPIQISCSAPLTYVFSRGALAAGLIPGQGGVAGMLLSLGEHVRMVPAGCDTLTVAGRDATGGEASVQRYPKITGGDINW